MRVTLFDVRNAVRAAGLSHKPVCVHASLRSFGWVEDGAQTIIEAFLAEGCTVLVFTLSFQFFSAPPLGQRPAQNGLDYGRFSGIPINVGPVYSVDSQELEKEIVGAVPAAVLAMPGHVRGNHPHNSFTAVGPLANRLVSGQTPRDVYAPLRMLADLGGYVALIGVGLDKMTLIHLAEQQAGRNLLRRWANGGDGQPIETEEGGCSDGFVRLEAALSPLETRAQVGSSLWRMFPAEATLEAATQAIQGDPMITHCGDLSCLECRDAVLGGPLVN